MHGAHEKTAKLALRLSNIPKLVGEHDNIVRLGPSRFVETGGGAKRRGVFRQKNIASEAIVV
jgi:hypothetical protein